MIKEKVSKQETVDFLNHILKIDPDAVNNLFSIRVGCNKVLARHPSVQVGKITDDYFIVGMMGVLNGLFGSDEHGWGHIVIDCIETKIVGFHLLSNNDVEKYINKEEE